MVNHHQSYTSHWVKSINEISREQWISCFDKSKILTGYDFQCSIENAQLVNVNFHYLLVSQGKQLVAIIPCFSYTYSLVELASNGVRKIVDGIRKIFPHAGYYSIFVAGSPVATCKNMLGINIAIISDTKAMKDVMDTVSLCLQVHAKNLGISLIAIKEIESNYLNIVHSHLSDKFAICESPATTYVYTAPIDGNTYIENMYSKYRVAYKKRLKNFTEAGLSWKKSYDFEQYSEQMCNLYLNVLARSSVKFEQLTPEFFKQISSRLNDKSYALLCFKEEKLVAFELFLVDEQLHPIYLGMDYSLRDHASLYFNCIYRIIEEAQHNNQPFIELGQTSYDVKASLGAVVDRLYIAVMHTNPIANLMIKRYRHLLFPPTQLPKPRHIFKNLTQYHASLKESNIHFELES